ncbi:MAG: UDP-N-acetylmuramate dehydrogenase [Pseudomonadota bacterium]
MSQSARSHLTAADLPPVRGRMIENADLSALTWFRVGGPADTLFMPADADDLAQFLRAVDPDIPVFPMGVGSNLLVRDGGIRGVVVRLARGFTDIHTDGVTVHAGAAALDAQVAKKAAAAGIGGLEFYCGVPGTIGGALTMNAGAYGRETCDVMIEATGFDRQGTPFAFTGAEMDFAYRHCGVAAGRFFTGAIFRGMKDDPGAIEARMAQIMRQREDSQPIRERTGGSTFANPPGEKSWALIDSVGGRGRRFGDAEFSEQHCNFLINRGAATAADLERLGEGVRADVRARHDIDLRWEIKRVGEPRIDGVSP